MTLKSQPTITLRKKGKYFYKKTAISQSPRWDPTPPKVCKTPESFKIGLFENFKSLYCLKSNLEKVIIKKPVKKGIFVDFLKKSKFQTIIS